MTHHLKTSALLLCILAAAATGLNAQVVNDIRAHIDHSFVIENTTLPPGDYVFRPSRSSDLSAMTVSSANDKINEEFLVREAIDDHTPTHSELVFRKYGDTEFLSKIFENGSKIGLEVTENSRQEARFAQQHQHPSEHTEVQK